MFSLITVWIHSWVNNGEAGDLRRYRGHYDDIVMIKPTHAAVTGILWDIYVQGTQFVIRGTFYWQGLTLITCPVKSRMKLLIHFNSCTVDVWGWISNFSPHFMTDIITNTCWDMNYTMLVKGLWFMLDFLFPCLRRTSLRGLLYDLYKTSSVSWTMTFCPLQLNIKEHDNRTRHYDIKEQFLTTENHGNNKLSMPRSWFISIRKIFSSDQKQPHLMTILGFSQKWNIIINLFRIPTKLSNQKVFIRTLNYAINYQMKKAKPKWIRKHRISYDYIIGCFCDYGKLRI